MRHLILFTLLLMPIYGNSLVCTYEPPEGINIHLKYERDQIYFSAPATLEGNSLEHISLEVFQRSKNGEQSDPGKIYIPLSFKVDNDVAEGYFTFTVKALEGYETYIRARYSEKICGPQLAKQEDFYAHKE